MKIHRKPLLGILIVVLALPSSLWAAATTAPFDLENALVPNVDANAATGPRVSTAGGRQGVAPGGPITAHRAGGKDLPNPVPNRFKNLRIDTGFVGGEPTLGITERGTVLVQSWAINEDLPDPGVIRSTDNGQTWKDVSPGPDPDEDHLFALDPHLYVDRDTGRTLTASFLLPCHRLSISDDEGKTWETSTGNCNMVDREVIFGGPPPKDVSTTNDYPNVLYFCTASVGYAHNTCNRSFDGGETWLPGGVTFETTPQGLQYSSIASSNGYVDGEGIVYVTKADHLGQPYLAISGDAGLTWERVQVSDLGSQWHDAGIGGDAAGNLYYAWIANDRLPYLTISRNGGKTWSKPLMVGVPGIKEASQPELAVGSTGKVAVTYMGSTNSPYQRCQVSCGADQYERTTWNGYMTFSHDALAKEPLFYSASVNALDDPLVRGTCRQQRCQGTLDFHDLQIAPDGSIWGAFVATCFADSCSHAGALGTAYGRIVMGRVAGGGMTRGR